MTQRFDHKRARDTAWRLRNRLPAEPLIGRETAKRIGDLVIFAHRVERVG